MPRAAAREREKGLGMERETREAATGYRELIAGFVVPLGVRLQRPGRGRGARCLGDGRGWLLDRDVNNSCVEKQPDTKEYADPHLDHIRISIQSYGLLGTPPRPDA